jgi:putative transposase
VQRVFKDKPPRLELIFQRFNSPVYFVTFNTHVRARLLATNQVHEAFIKYCRRAAEFQVGVGRYVIMPDHIHLFVCFGIGCTSTLGAWVKGVKRELDRVLLSTGHQPVQLTGQKLSSFWQPGFNDHVLRNDESYAQKWEYVFQNPVRGGLVARAEDWPYAGEIIRIDRSNLATVASAVPSGLFGRPCAEDSARYSGLSQLTTPRAQRK